MLLLMGWIALALVVGWAASQKNRSSVGFFCLSLVASPVLGLLVLIALPGRSLAPSQPNTAQFSAALPQPETKQCPACAETILAAARKCRYCGADQFDRASPGKPEPAAVMTTCPGCGKARSSAQRVCVYCKDASFAVA